jgi:NitT/TauT family transport system ATP-binding protein
MSALAESTRPAVAAPPFVEVRGVTKRFAVRATGRTARKAPPETMTALDNIDLDVREGEFLSLLGPSGCGKTTLLRMLAGLVTPDEGEITAAGKVVTGPDRQTCMVFQNFGLLPWRTVLHNVELPLELDGRPSSERTEIARRFIALVGLRDFEGHYPHELSGGMQQRVGIARALVRRPWLLLMDEPFGALDAQTREQMQDEFLQIWATTRTTVVFVTHSIDEALVMSDRIAVFTPRPGRIKAVIPSPFGEERAGRDLRTHPDYVEIRSSLRGLLR